MIVSKPADEGGGFWHEIREGFIADLKGLAKGMVVNVVAGPVGPLRYELEGPPGPNPDAMLQQLKDAYKTGGWGGVGGRIVYMGGKYLVLKEAGEVIAETAATDAAETTQWTPEPDAARTTIWDPEPDAARTTEWVHPDAADTVEMNKYHRPTANRQAAEPPSSEGPEPEDSQPTPSSERPTAEMRATSSTERPTAKMRTVKPVTDGLTVKGSARSGTPPVRIVSPVYRISDRDVVVVQTSRGRQAFYRSSGDNSGNPGKWYPVDEFYPKPFGGDPDGWFNKAVYGRPRPVREGTPLHRLGNQEFADISNQLGERNIPGGEKVPGSNNEPAETTLNRTLDFFGARETPATAFRPVPEE
jgi:hypothetical protein